MIFVKSANSASSFWVTFERDYAIRAGKKVFAYNSEGHALIPDGGKALEIPVYSTMTSKANHTYQAIKHFMKHDRYFDLISVDDVMGDPGQHIEELLSGYEKYGSPLARGGYIVAWISNFTDSMKRSELHYASESWPDRILPVLLDPVTWRLPPWLKRISVPVYLNDDHPNEINWNRVDDVIVRIYHLVHQAGGLAPAPTRPRPLPAR